MILLYHGSVNNHLKNGVRGVKNGLKWVVFWRTWMYHLIDWKKRPVNNVIEVNNLIEVYSRLGSGVLAVDHINFAVPIIK